MSKVNLNRKMPLFVRGLRIVTHKKNDDGKDEIYDIMECDIKYLPRSGRFDRGGQIMLEKMITALAQGLDVFFELNPLIVQKWQEPKIVQLDDSTKLYRIGPGYYADGPVGKYKEIVYVSYENMIKSLGYTPVTIIEQGGEE